MRAFAAHLLMNGVRLSEKSWSWCGLSPTCGEQSVRQSWSWNEMVCRRTVGELSDLWRTEC